MVEKQDVQKVHLLAVRRLADAVLLLPWGDGGIPPKKQQQAFIKQSKGSGV